MKRKTVKNALLTFMVVMFSISLVRAGFNVERIAFAVFRMMMASLAVGVIMGVVFKPRSWCQICPMGHATSLLK
jgi:predicted membrane protein